MFKTVIEKQKYVLRSLLLSNINHHYRNQIITLIISLLPLWMTFFSSSIESIGIIETVGPLLPNSNIRSITTSSPFLFPSN